MRSGKDNNKRGKILDDFERELFLNRERLDTVIELSSGFYWEEDENYRLTFYWHRETGRSDSDGDTLGLLGRHVSELGKIPAAERERWEAHMAVRDARQPFYGFVRAYIHPELGLRYTRVSGVPVFDDEDRFLGYRGVAQDITEAVLAERLLQLETSILRFLSDKQDVEECVRGAMKMICEAQGWEAGSFWELDESSNVLRYKAGWSNERNEIIAGIMAQAKNFHFQRGDGLPGWVWETGEMVYVPDIKNDPRMGTTEITDLTGWNAAFLFPVTVEGRFLGVLDFYAPEIPEPTERLLNVIRLLGTEVGYAYERTRTIVQLRESEARFRSLTELSSDWYWEQDSEFRFIRFEGRDSAMIDFMRKSYIGKRSWDIDDGNAADENRAETVLKEYMENHEPFRDIVLYRRISPESDRYVSVSGEPVFDDNGRFAGYRGVSRDVTEEKWAEQKIQYLATHDHLTGLPNRTLFSQLLNYSLETARRYNRGFVVMVIDLDHFKNVNDTLGHHAGDRLLIEIAGRFSACLRESDIIARTGGDEFVALVQEITEKDRAVQVAQNLLVAAAGPVRLQKQECRVGASIGMSMFPQDADNEEDLLRQADSAMYLAKDSGKNTCRFFSDGFASS